MSTQNPYQTPSVQDRVLEKLRDYHELDDKALKKLYYRSCNVNAIAFLLMLGSAFSVLLALGNWYSEGSVGFTQEIGQILFFSLAGCQFAGFIGLAIRSVWGRIFGFIGCTIMLINIPLGTLIGIVGLVALSKAPELFGQARVTHKELKAEFKQRKCLKKEAKKLAKIERKTAKA